MLVSNINKYSLIIITSLVLGACQFSPVKTPEQAPPADSTVKMPTSTQTNKPTVSDKRKQQIKQAIQQADTDKPVQVNDLWVKIANELEFDRHVDHPAVREKIIWYQNNQDYLYRVAERAAPYLYYITSEIEQRNLPMDLALLPIIESAYHPFAYSPSRASGIWQFMSATGKQYGLQQNWWYDGRRDIVASTQAALKYLTTLNKQFNGDWPLALAAYNAGPGNVSKAIKRNAVKGKATDYWSLKLHRETRHYVPGLMAIAEIISNPDKYNVTFTPIPNRPHFSIVNIMNQIDLATVADLSGLEMDAVYQLNPGFNRWATAPGGPHRLILPLDVTQTFKQRLAQLPENERLQWQKHKIKQGETLSQIARKYATNVHALKSSNRLKTSRIRAGHYLLIPTAKRPLKSYTLSQESRKYKGLKRSQDGQDYIYRIKRGDTLWDISRHYGISVTQLCRWNGISRKSTLRLGQKLHIRIDPEQESPKFIKAATQVTDSGLYKIDYQVQDGDSLWLIARHFGVTVKQLKDWNNLVNGRYLQPGQNISVFTDKKPTGA